MQQYQFPEHRHRWYVIYTYWILKNILGPIFRIVWINKVEGIENIPKDGPVIVAFNHQSYFDFLCFIAICPRPIHFLSAEKFFSHKVWRHFMRYTGQIKVHRTEHDKHILHATVNDHLKNNKVIGIFPEGTRSQYPSEMLHAFTGVAKYAVNSEVPIVPVGITGAYEVWSRNDKLPKFKKSISFKIGLPMHFNRYYKQNLTETDYTEITDTVMVAISRLSGKSYAHIGKVEREKVSR